MSSLFSLLKSILRSTSVSFYILSLIYLPGTVLHEVSHLLTSVVLYVMPHGMSFIPAIEKHEKGYAVRFGSVHHVKTDPIRGILIGSSPIFAGICFFYAVFAFGLFPHESIAINSLFIYLFFSISSSMFLSKEDLKDSLILVPLLILLVSLFIGFKIDLTSYVFSDTAISLMKNLNLYLASATITNGVLFLFFRFFRR